MNMFILYYDGEPLKTSRFYAFDTLSSAKRVMTQLSDIHGPKGYKHRVDPLNPKKFSIVEYKPCD